MCRFNFSECPLFSCNYSSLLLGHSFVSCFLFASLLLSFSLPFLVVLMVLMEIGERETKRRVGEDRQIGGKLKEIAV